MDDGIRYRPGNAHKNSILRLALLESWGNRCYWCRKPSDHSAVEIDHIIPQKLDKSRLAKFLDRHLAPDLRRQFDIHALGNPAPICGKCNGEKSDSDLLETGQVTTSLVRARALQPKVAGLVRSFQSSRSVAKAMLSASIADMSDPRSRQAFMEFAPLVLNRISVLAPEMLSTPSVNHEVVDPYASDYHYRAVFILDSAAQRIRVLMEDFYEMDFDDVAVRVMSAVRNAVVDRVRNAIALNFEKLGYNYPEVGDPAGRLIIEADALMFDRSGEFTVTGTFDVDMSALVAVFSDSDSGTGWLEGDTDAHGRFAVSFFPDESSPEGAEVDSSQITDWKPGRAPW